MKTSNNINELATALVAFQSKMPTLPKDAKGGMGNFKYSYTPLDTVVESVTPILTECGLSYVQMPSSSEFSGVALTTRLMHSSGQWLEDTMTIPLPSGKMNETQQYGSALTYARRYALTAMLGIVADEDSDGAIQDNAPRASSKPQKKQVDDSQRKPSEGMIRKLHAIGAAAYGDEWDEKRAALITSVTNNRSNQTKHLTFDECKKLIDGIEARSK